MFAKAMFNICRRMMGDEDEAKDTLQEAFIEAFSKLEKLQDEMVFPAWLKRIVVNKCINALRKKKDIYTDLNSDLPILEQTEGDDDYTRFKAEKVMNAIDQISEGCKVVTNLYLFEGYDHKEIASILSISESASKAQYSKAKSKIRKILNG